MNPADKRQLHTPQSVKGVFLEEAHIHRQLLRLTEDHFVSWGYMPVLTPIFDYFEAYRTLLDNQQIERSYRFTDREGELLILRSDITLFLAKQIGLALKGQDLPVRFYYADSILRHQEEKDITRDEFFQAGAELIGMPGCNGDMEILMLLYDLLQSLELPPWRMHIGSRAMLNAVLENHMGSIDKAGHALKTRDRDMMQGLIESTGLSCAPCRTDFLMFIGTLDEFESTFDSYKKNCKDFRNQAIEYAAQEILSIGNQLKQVADMDKFRIDLSEIGDQAYYTGFTVKAFVEGASVAVATGGRYDHLLKSFGSDLPAAGFSLLTRLIEPLSHFADDAQHKMQSTTAQGKDFTERYKDALEQRRNGKKVSIS